MTERIYLSPPDVGPRERELLLDAFDSNWIAPLGPHVDALEAELAARADVGHCAALSTGTAALQLGLLVLDVQPGDVVITSSQTFAATANAITYVGAEPVFIDSDPDTWTMDVGLLDHALTTLRSEGAAVGGVVPVDLYGQTADLDTIAKLCDHHDVPLLVDAAESLGATHRSRPSGNYGAASVFSFNGNKIITGSTGGALVSDDKALVDRVRHLSTQAREPVVHYEHTEIGFNFRMSNLVAAVIRGALEQLDDKIDKRRAVRERYVAALGDRVDFLEECAYGTMNHWLTCIRVPGGPAMRDAIVTGLAASEIEARPTWKPMHLQPVFAGARSFGGEVSAAIFDDGVCLPSGSSLTLAQQDRVVTALTQVLDACGRDSS